MPIEIETYDHMPDGWHVLNVMRCQSRKWDWVAFAINVHPDALKHYRCKVAFLYVHPDEYRPEAGRVAREALVRIPGKHRNQDAAWEALQQMCEVQSSATPRPRAGCPPPPTGASVVRFQPAPLG